MYRISIAESCDGMSQ